MTARCLLFCLFLALPAFARKVPITILHTTDLHGHLFPTRDYTGRENVGGLLRCSKRVSELREGRNDVLLVDCGDFIQGGPESFLSKGETTRIAMEWMRYDAVVVGNHEFDWGLPVIGAFQDAFSCPLIAANITSRPGGSPLDKVKPWVIRDVNGVRVAIVGLTTPGMPHWFRPAQLGPLVFERSLLSLKRVLPAVRAEKPDVMVLAAHMGYPAFGRQRKVNEIDQVLNQVPDFDIILGGHTHQVHEQRQGDTLYAQAGYHGIWLGQVDLLYDTVQKKVISSESTVHDIDEGVGFDLGLEARLKPLLKKSRLQLDEQIGIAKAGFQPVSKLPGQSAVQGLLAAAIADAVDADFVLHGVLSDSGRLHEGPITLRDLFRIVPYENDIGTARLTPKEIRLILEENLAHFRRVHFLGAHGLTYELDFDADPGNRVRGLRLPDGKALHSSKRYRVAFNSFVLASGGGRFPELRRIVDTPKARLAMSGMATRDAVKRYIQSAKSIEPVVLPGAVLKK